MSTKFVCLANSFKERGRCIAGIEIDSNHSPVRINDRPKWIRPVCDTLHGEVPNQIAEPYELLHIIELDVLASKPQNYQSENVTFKENSMKIVGNFDKNGLASLCDTDNSIFGNKGKAISKTSIAQPYYSLMLVAVTEFEVTKRIYEDRPDKPQRRLAFTYQGNKYDFPITDPAFLRLCLENPNAIQEVNHLYLTLSLGIEWKDWYYKLIAGIFS